MIERLSEFWRQKRRDAERDLWCWGGGRGDMGSRSPLFMVDSWLLGLLGTGSPSLDWTKTSDRYSFILFIRFKNKSDSVYFYVISTHKSRACSSASLLCRDRERCLIPYACVQPSQTTVDVSSGEHVLRAATSACSKLVCLYYINIHFCTIGIHILSE